MFHLFRDEIGWWVEHGEPWVVAYGPFNTVGDALGFAHERGWVEI